MTLLTFLIFITTFASFATEMQSTTSEEFTWARYEMECMKRGTEPSYERYEELAGNPQCLVSAEEEEEELTRIMKISKN